MTEEKYFELSGKLYGVLWKHFATNGKGKFYAAACDMLHSVGTKDPDALYERVNRWFGDDSKGQWALIEHYSSPCKPMDAAQAMDALYDEIMLCIKESE